MRKLYVGILRSLFHRSLIRRRAELGLTQEEMAYRLEMACRTYIELDHGKSTCSALTLALYLIYVCADPVGFLKELRNAFEEANEKAA